MIGYATSDFLDNGVDLADPVLYGTADAPVLPPPAYRSPVFAAMEDERIWTPLWVCIGTTADVPQAGDLLPYTVGAQGVHLQRDNHGGLIGRYNKAQHGGCRFVPLQCQTGTKTSCSFTSCGYSRDRMPIKGAALTETSRQTFQYLGLRPERLPPVPWVAIGSLLFVNLDPAWSAARAAPVSLPAGWAPGAGAIRQDAQWHEAEANWKLLAQALAAGDPLDDPPQSGWVHSRTMLPHGGPVDVLWLFPNLLIWRGDAATWVCVLQPTAVGKTLCRLRAFGAGPVPDGWRDWFAARATMAERAQTASRARGEPFVNTAAHIVAFCNRQVTKNVLTGRPGYQPGLMAPTEIMGTARHG